MSQTPTPWKVAELYGGEDFVIRCHAGSDRKVGYGFTVQDAAFIVQCVNSHDALIMAVEKSTAALTAWLHQYAPDVCEDEAVHTNVNYIDSCGGTLALIARQLGANRAALALAKKGQP